MADIALLVVETMQECERKRKGWENKQGIAPEIVGHRLGSMAASHAMVKQGKLALSSFMEFKFAGDRMKKMERVFEPKSLIGAAALCGSFSA